MKKLIIVSVTALLFSCMSTQSGLSPTSYTSGFDQAAVVEIQAHGMDCKAACLMLGAQWKQKHPDSVYINLTNYMSLANLYELEINIDGRIVEPLESSYSTDHSHEYNVAKSTKVYVMLLRDFDEMIKAKRVWFRVRSA